MLTNEIRSQIDQIWNAFWSGGISNPLEVIEQVTYLLFIKRLDELQTLEEAKVSRFKTRSSCACSSPAGALRSSCPSGSMKNISQDKVFGIQTIFPRLSCSANSPVEFKRWKS